MGPAPSRSRTYTPSGSELFPASNPEQVAPVAAEASGGRRGPGSHRHQWHPVPLAAKPRLLSCRARHRRPLRQNCWHPAPLAAKPRLLSCRLRHRRPLRPDRWRQSNLWRRQARPPWARLKRYILDGKRTSKRESHLARRRRARLDAPACVRFTKSAASRVMGRLHRGCGSPPATRSAGSRRWENTDATEGLRV